MEKKIKLLSVCRKKPKKENTEHWKEVVERYAPGMYEPIHSAGEKDTLEKVRELKPEIILILPSVTQKDLMDGVSILQKIKQIHPDAVVLVNISMADDEEEAMDLFMSNGAYKCYLPPFVMDTLFHDMYVAMNLE